MKPLSMLKGINLEGAPPQKMESKYIILENHAFPSNSKEDIS